MSNSKKKTRRWAVSIILLIIGVFSAIALSGCGQAATITMITPKVYADSISTSDHILLDVRTPEEFEEARIEGSVNIPLDDLPLRLDELPKDANIVVYCRSGNRSLQGAEYLIGQGYSNIFELGGIIDWVEAGYGYISG